MHVVCEKDNDVDNGVENGVDNGVEDGDDHSVEDGVDGADKHFTHLSQAVNCHFTQRSKQNKHFVCKTTMILTMMLTMVMMIVLEMVMMMVLKM
eukprot:2221619-Ditylum_brightwellii.AAC.1